MKCQYHWWRKPEYLEETTDLQQVTDRPMAITNFNLVVGPSWPGVVLSLYVLLCYKVNANGWVYHVFIAVVTRQQSRKCPCVWCKGKEDIERGRGRSKFSKVNQCSGLGDDLVLVSCYNPFSTIWTENLLAHKTLLFLCVYVGGGCTCLCVYLSVGVCVGVCACVCVCVCVLII